MNKKELLDYCIPTEERDGFDQAFYDGILHVIHSCGDGGLSHQYINGLRFALSHLKEEDYE